MGAGTENLTLEPVRAPPRKRPPALGAAKQDTHVDEMRKTMRVSVVHTCDAFSLSSALVEMLKAGTSPF